MSLIELPLTNQTYNILGLHYFLEVSENRAQAHIYSCRFHYIIVGQ